jgi:hypothetical protein
LIAVVGVVIARGVFGTPLYGSPQSGVWGSGRRTGSLLRLPVRRAGDGPAVPSAATTPSPITYLGWIVVLVTAVAEVLPLTVATALINAAIGIAIGTLTVSAARRSILYVPPTEPELQPAFI